MKLRKILLDDHYSHYWRGPILPDPYPPDHPRAPCYKCNQICQGLINWLERMCHWVLFPTRRYRTRYIAFAAVLFLVLLALNANQHPTTMEHGALHNSAPSSWRTYLGSLVFGSPRSTRTSNKGLVQDWVFAPNCEALFAGEDNEIHFVKRMLYREVRDKVTDVEYLLQTQSCSEFRATEGYPTHALSQEEEGFPLAYIIQGYKSVEQLHRLLRAVYAPQNPYCICTNHKATTNFDTSIRSIASCFQNVFHVSTLRFNRTTSLPLSELDDIKCVQKCMKILSSANWKYLVKIHGQDYPLVSNQFIVTKLKNLERIKAPFISDYGHMQKKQTIRVAVANTSHELLETDVTLWRASPFFILSKAIVLDLLASPLPSKLLPSIQHHEHPESYFWATLILYLIGDANHAAVVAANKHRIQLQTFKHYRTNQYCAGITQLQEHCILGVEDLSKLFHQRQNQFFAHAFDLDHDHVAYSCLEQRLDNILVDGGANLSASFADPKIHASHPEMVLFQRDNTNRTNVAARLVPRGRTVDSKQADSSDDDDDEGLNLPDAFYQDRTTADLVADIDINTTVAPLDPHVTSTPDTPVIVEKTRPHRGKDADVVELVNITAAKSQKEVKPHDQNRTADGTENSPHTAPKDDRTKRNNRTVETEDLIVKDVVETRHSRSVHETQKQTEATNDEAKEIIAEEAKETSKEQKDPTTRNPRNMGAESTKNHTLTR